MRLQEKYNIEILPKLKEEFKYKNISEVPKLTKVVLNVGFGKRAKEKAHVDLVVDGITRIAGQKPMLTKAKKSISSFKLREGQVIGAAVTLRGKRMYDFVEKLINVTFPRVRDFRGIDEKLMDRTGNMTIGFKEQLAFPEIKADDIESLFGLEICLATTAKNSKEGLELFKLLGFPFKKINK